MSNKIKYTYFNARGRGELIRFIFIVGNIDFEDNRIEFQDWLKLKPKIPTGQLPILYLPDGTFMNESMAISRYFARKCHLIGSTEMDEYNADRIVSTLYDLYLKVPATIWEKNESLKQRFKEELKNIHLPNILHKVNDYLDENKGDFFLGKQPSYADLYLVDVLDHFTESDYSQFPKLVNCYKKVLEHYPKLKEYKSSRPITIT